MLLLFVNNNKHVQLEKTFAWEGDITVVLIILLSPADSLIGPIMWHSWWLCYYLYMRFHCTFIAISFLTYTQTNDLNTHSQTKGWTQLSTKHMLMSENNTCMSAFVAASSRPSVCLRCACTHVSVFVWALGFSPADVSNQSPSTGSLSLYPLSVEPWVNWAGLVHPCAVWSWVVVV